MNDVIHLTPRLAAAASFVRGGSVAADVGTDHAYLPLYLVLTGKVARAVATDVADGPIDRAKENVSLYRDVCGKIELYKADGLHGIEKHSPDDILICGMGGELIARILSGSAYVRNKDIRLILQPMSKEERLRAFLYSNGFDITDETIVREGDKLYQIIVANFDGTVRAFTQAEALIGKCNIKRGSDNMYLLTERKTEAAAKKIKGLQTSGKDAGEYIDLLMDLEEIMSGKDGRR